MVRHVILIMTALAAAAFGSAQPAQAITTGVSYISGSGDDSNAAAFFCSFAHPCGSFGAALGVTTAGGEIICLDGTGVTGGAVTITRSVTINCSTSVGWEFPNVGTAAFTVNGAGITVVLRGLSIFIDASFTGPIGVGVDILAAQTVVIDNCHVHGFTQSGVLLRPTGTSQLTVVNSRFSANGSSGVGAGIRVFPGAGGAAFVSIEKSTFAGNVYGIAIDATGGAAGINGLIVDSLVSQNSQDGIVAVSGGPIGLSIDLARSAHNGGYGIRAIGGSATVRVARSAIVGNAVGVAGQSAGSLLSSGSNLLETNGTDGAFTDGFTLK